ncbi:phosphatase PAP2 family protein [Streptomyces sp. 7-21]|uniref:phosphatase PAP2 family protein n=1 Tax=Streptomyces sp. 7-21 TaxID=2802283 RepID=UPI00191E5CA2|nr:phosphatase PAP2 family protein [Streptomyces sp. 7-21]MBL1068940.1 phosphatase PAP2 family protein [Streptomyces sp. 7-21]
MVGIDDRDMDVEILRDVNGLAARMPGWARDVVAFTGEYLLPLSLIALVAVAWLVVRRRPGNVTAVAQVLWALPAAALAYLVNAPIRDFVARPRPAIGRPELDLTVLLDKDGYSFVSDHASCAMAIAVALFLVHRWLGALACAAALLTGFGRLLIGVHYPSDVIGGYALGAAVALLLAPLAMATLTPLVRRAAGTRWLGWLVPASAEAAGEAGDAEEKRADHPGSQAGREGASGQQDRPAPLARDVAV